MAELTASANTAEKRAVVNGNAGGTAGFAYLLAFLGALIYFIQQANSFWEGALGVLKAMVWPAFLVYRVFQYLGV